ncbi:MAG: hypothetical protein U0931_37270 [Vulcanimicrobiota bacterium]
MSSEIQRSLRRYRKLLVALVGLFTSYGCGGDLGSTPSLQSSSAGVAESSTSQKSDSQDTTTPLVFESAEASITSDFEVEPTYHLAPVYPPEPLPVDVGGGSQSATMAPQGDSGAGVSWPAASPNVVAVGGTTLSFAGTGARSETAWSGTGGGVSAYEPRPAYQASSVPGLGSVTRRSVADVAFNADPSSGQYVAVIRNQTGSASFLPVSWVTAGGTSLSTPQWAALMAVASAMRVQAGKPALGDPHAPLYVDLASVSANYAASFLDVSQGSNGSGAANAAKAGYDAPTGLGTPNGLNFLYKITGVSASPAPPLVTGASLSSLVRVPLSFTPVVSDANPYTITLSGAPAGMTVGSNGVVSWASPVLGTYSVTVTARDSKTGLTGQGIYKIQVDNPPAPALSTGSATGSAGSALSFQINIAASNPYTLSLSGAPAGMTINSTGGVSWPKPVAGSYSFRVTAKDNSTGLVGQGFYQVVINSGSNLPPTLSSGNFVAKAGTAWKYNVVLNNLNACTLSLSGAPTGMTISSSGLVSWASPVAGTYNFTVLAKDGRSGLSGQGICTLTVGAAAGPVITALSMAGGANQALRGTISITSGGAALTFLGAGGPQGMVFSPQAGGLNTLTASWASPVAGNYLASVQSSDSAGIQAMAWIPVTIRK